MRKKILITLIVILDLVVLVVIINNYLPQPLVPYIKWISKKEKAPMAYVVPEIRQIPFYNTPSTSTPFSISGFNFKTPYTLVNKTDEGSITKLEFADGKNMVILSLGEKKLIDTITEHMEKKDRNRIKNILGEANVKNNFELARWILNTNPNDLKIYSSEDEISEKMMLISLKILLSQGEGESIFNFSTPEFRGFQIGKLQKEAESKIQLLLFDKNDIVYNILFVGKNIVQKDIDFVLNSAQKSLD